MSQLDSEVYNEIFTIPSKMSKKFNHFDIDEPHDTHQVDLLYMPRDYYKNKGYKYILCVIDCASRYKAARPLTKRTGESVLENLKDIYQNDPYMILPFNFNFDLGSEFKNSDIKNFCKELEINVKYNEKSFHLGFVESMNRELAKILFKDQQIMEIETGKTNRQWVKNLPAAVLELNNRVTKMINMKPIDAIKLDKVPQPRNEYSKKITSMFHPIGTKVRRLLNKDEIQDLPTATIKVDKRRATDSKWSLEIFEVVGVYKSTGKLQMHQIKSVDESGDIWKHYYTYWQLLPTKIK